MWTDSSRGVNKYVLMVWMYTFGATADDASMSSVSAPEWFRCLFADIK